MKYVDMERFLDTETKVSMVLNALVTLYDLHKCNGDADRPCEICAMYDKLGLLTRGG